MNSNVIIKVVFRHEVPQRKTLLSSRGVQENRYDVAIHYQQQLKRFKILLSTRVLLCTKFLHNSLRSISKYKEQYFFVIFNMASYLLTLRKSSRTTTETLKPIQREFLRGSYFT